MVEDLLFKFRRSYGTVDSARKENASQEITARKATDRPTSFQSSPYEIVPGHNNLFNYLPQLPRSVDLFAPNFAQRLHVQAIRAGLQLVCTAEDSSQLFYRVFNRVLDISTREGYRAYLNRVLRENFNQSPNPPSESDLDKLWSEGESCVWLNASDVANHFAR
jgi:hypothetical protein